MILPIRIYAASKKINFYGLIQIDMGMQKFAEFDRAKCPAGLHSRNRTP